LIICGSCAQRCEGLHITYMCETVISAHFLVIAVDHVVMHTEKRKCLTLWHYVLKIMPFNQK